MAADGGYDLVAACACPTGVALTFMAREGLERAARARGLSIKVETHGQAGTENELTPEEVESARAVIIAADKDVRAERFAGRPVVRAGVTAAIRDPGALVDEAIAAADRDRP